LGRRQRQRERAGASGQPPGQAPWPEAPTSEYSDSQGSTLELRGALTPGTRREYQAVLEGSPLSREDAWHRAAEFLFERLAVRWVIAGVPVEGQRELLARYRVASPQERAWVRDVLRRHCAEHFPDVATP